MCLSDKAFIIIVAIVIVLYGIFILTDTPIQKATKEYVKNGDIVYYEYK